MGDRTGDDAIIHHEAVLRLGRRTPPDCVDSSLVKHLLNYLLAGAERRYPGRHVFLTASARLYEEYVAYYATYASGKCRLSICNIGGLLAWNRDVIYRRRAGDIHSPVGARCGCTERQQLQRAPPLDRSEAFNCIRPANSGFIFTYKHRRLRCM